MKKKTAKLYFCMGCRSRLNFSEMREGEIAKCPCGGVTQIAVGITDGRMWFEAAEMETKDDR